VSAADGRSLPEGRTQRIGRGNLEIRNIAKQDAGLYQCSLLSASDVSSEALVSVMGM